MRECDNEDAICPIGSSLALYHAIVIITARSKHNRDIDFIAHEQLEREMMSGSDK